MISDCCGAVVHFQDICPLCGEHCEDQGNTVTREDITYFIENEIGGYVAENYTIVEQSNGLAVRCGSFMTATLTDANFTDAIYDLVSNVSYNLVYDRT
jgi:hypothetical protein